MEFNNSDFQQRPSPETETNSILSDVDANNLTTQQWSAHDIHVGCPMDSDRNEATVQRGPITRIDVKSFSTIALWSWKDNVQVCAICRSTLLETCNTCEGGGIMNPTLCQSVKGPCDHIFHYHCIQRWLVENRPYCPLCNGRWPAYSDSHTSLEVVSSGMWDELEDGQVLPLPFE